MVGGRCLSDKRIASARETFQTVTLRRRRNAAASKGDGPTAAAGPLILRGLRCAPAPQDDGLTLVRATLFNSSPVEVRLTGRVVRQCSEDLGHIAYSSFSPAGKTVISLK
jgi:hypothetical protein